MTKYYLSVTAMLFMLLSQHSWALTILELNTEFLWDHRTPHEGRIIDERKPAPTEDEYRYEITTFSQLIISHNADIVGLLEIEGCHISKDFVYVLNKIDTDNNWSHSCLKGRDSFTGQDVAILTKHQVVRGTANNHKTSVSMMGSKRVRPSKVLSTIIEVESESYLVTVAHLISKAGDNDLKRLHQAKAITGTVDNLIDQYEPAHVILMGDLNDTSDSEPVLEFEKLGLINPATAGTCSYIYRGTCNLIDHILISPSLAGGELTHLDINDELSDHHSIKYTLNKQVN